MANLIQIRRSLNTATPTSLANGELAYTANGDALFIGSNGSIVAIGGKRNPGTLTANQALVANASGYLDTIKAANAVLTKVYANGSHGTAGQVLVSDGANVFWGTGTSGTNTQIQFNDSGVANGTAGFTFDKTSNTLFVGNTVTVGSNVSLTVSSLSIGNSTVNSVVNSSTVSTGSATLKTSISIGNSTVNTIANSSTIEVTNLSVSNAVITKISANGTYGSGNTVLTSNGSGGMYWAAPVADLDGLTDVAVSSASAGQVLISNSTGFFRNKSLSGDITVDADGVVSISADAVALGTDTTGDYVQTITAGAGISGSVTGEGSTPTIAVVANNGIVANSSGVFAKAANGVSVDSNGINVVAGNGLLSNATGVSVVANNGIVSNTSGVFAKAANGTSVDSSGINVTAGTDGGLVSNTTGVFVLAGDALVTNATGLHVGAGDGVSVNATAVSVVANSGLASNSSGVHVVANSGITSNTSGVFVRSGTDGGLVSNSTGVFVLAGDGLATNATGLHVGAGAGIGTDASNVFVVANSGIVSNTSGVFVNANDGVVANATGVYVKAGTGVTVNATGVHIGQSVGTTDNVTFNDVTINGNTKIGNASSDVVQFNAQVNSHIIPAANVTYSLGNNTLRFYEVHAQNTHTEFLYVDKDVEISGNLTVSGSLVTINVSTLAVTDSLIQLASNNTTSDTLDIGFFGNYNTDGGSHEHTGLFRDASTDTYKLFKGLQVAPTTVVDVNGAGYTTASLEAYLLSGGLVSNSTAVTLTANSTVAVNITANSLSLSTALPGGSGGTGLSTYTAEDLLVANSSNGFRKLSVGSEGYVLQVVSGVVAYGTLDGGSF